MKKPVIVSGSIISALVLMIIPFIHTTGTVVKGGTTSCHCIHISDINDPLSGATKDIYIDCTIRYYSFIGIEHYVEYHDMDEVPYSDINDYWIDKGDEFDIWYNPFFPDLIYRIK